MSCFLHDSEPLIGTGNQSGARTRAATHNLNLAPDKFLSSIKLVPRHCASTFEPHSCTLINFWSQYNLYRDTRNAHKNLYPDGKKCAIPSLHRDSFSAPLARGTRTLPGAVVGLRLLKHTAGPLCAIRCHSAR